MLHFSDYFYSSNHALNFPLLTSSSFLLRKSFVFLREIRLPLRFLRSISYFFFLIRITIGKGIEKTSIQVFLFFIFAIVSSHSFLNEKRIFRLQPGQSSV